MRIAIIAIGSRGDVQPYICQPLKMFSRAVWIRFLSNLHARILVR
jgi:hypothetical protein